MLTLKGNQPTLLEDVRLHLDDPAQADKLRHARTVDADHGRIETRDAFVCDNVGWLCERHAWPGLRAIGKLARQREINRITTETAWFLLSTPLSAERFAEVARGHWGIENSLRWVPDVTMNEDQSRTRLDHGPKRLALLRRWAFNACKLEPSKRSIKAKLKRAGWSDDFLTKLLARIA